MTDFAVRSLQFSVGPGHQPSGSNWSEHAMPRPHNQLPLDLQSVKSIDGIGFVGAQASHYQDSEKARSLRALNARQKGPVDNTHSPQLRARASGVTLGTTANLCASSFLASSASR